jgi:hypothetical protein
LRSMVLLLGISSRMQRYQRVHVTRHNGLLLLKRRLRLLWVLISFAVLSGVSLIQPVGYSQAVLLVGIVFMVIQFRVVFFRVLVRVLRGRAQRPLGRGGLQIDNKIPLNEHVAGRLIAVVLLLNA